MANKREIIQQIRFELEQLSAQNKHHDFESLCKNRVVPDY